MSAYTNHKQGIPILKRDCYPAAKFEAGMPISTLGELNGVLMEVNDTRGVLDVMPTQVYLLEVDVVSGVDFGSKIYYVSTLGTLIDLVAGVQLAFGKVVRVSESEVFPKPPGVQMLGIMLVN